MISIRPFKKGDNSFLLDIEKLCPQGNEQYAMGVDKSPDATDRYKIYDNWNLLVAEDDRKVVGSISWTVKQNRDKKYVYLAEVSVHPDFQKKGIASKLVREVEENAKDIKADHIYCYIFEPNIASKSLFKNLGYHKMQDMKSCAVSTYKKMDLNKKFEIKPVQKNEIHDVVDIINNYYSQHEHFRPYTPASFEHYMNSLPDYGMENFWVAKDTDKIVACAGLWDCSSLAESYFSKEPVMWKVMSAVYSFLGNFRETPYIPTEGEHFKLIYTADHAFENFDAMSSLLAHFNNLLVDWGRDFMVTTVDPHDDLLNIIRKLNPQVDTWSMFVKKCTGNQPKFNAIYVDVRDLIP